MARVEQSFEAHTKSIDKNGKLLSAEVPYIVFEATDEDDALQAVLDAAPETIEFNGSQIRLSSIEIDERCNAEVYKVNVSYEKSSSSSSDDKGNDVMEISFSSGGGTKHIVRSLGWKEYGMKAYLNQAGDNIGWDGELKGKREFAGIDVPTSNLQLTLTVTRKMSALDSKWQRNIAGLTGKVNDKKFQGYERGEVLFNGASFSGAEDADEVKVSYNFSIQLNETNVSLGKLESGTEIFATKLGWQYSSCIQKWNEEKQSMVNKLFRLDTVLKFGDFSKLGI